MQNIRPSRVCEPRAFAFYTGMNAAARRAFTEKARPAVPFGARRKRRVRSIRVRLRSGRRCLSRPQRSPQASFSSWIRSVSPWAWAARSDTALAASAMASALCLAISLTWTMDWLISSLAADCSSLAVAMALT